MRQTTYIDQILEPIVKPWIESGASFVLEEDGDSGHGPGHHNIVKKWKTENQLQYYINCPSSPDLSPIENCWQPPKQYIQKYPHYDDASTRGLIYEGVRPLGLQKEYLGRLTGQPQDSSGLGAL